MATSIELVGSIIVALVSTIVALDLWRLWHGWREIPLLGPLPLGGHAWQARPADEVVRNLPNLLTLAVMAVLPWLIADEISTPLWQPLAFTVAMLAMGAQMVAPKRYAVTRTHLFFDGWLVGWERLTRPTRTRGGRLVLQRRGWGPFAPLPLGGAGPDLALALAWITAAIDGPEAWAAIVADSLGATSDTEA